MSITPALDLRINAPESMPVGLHREAPVRLERRTPVVSCLPAERTRLGRQRADPRIRICTDGPQELVSDIALLRAPGSSARGDPARLVAALPEALGRRNDRRSGA